MTDYTPLRDIVAHKQIDDLPDGMAQCRRCTVIIGGKVKAGKEHLELCNWCEQELKTGESESDVRIMQERG